MKITEKIFNAATNEEIIIERDLTADEILEKEKISIILEEEQKIKEESENAKNAVRSKLEALGLTAEDLKVLGLGGN